MHVHFKRTEHGQVDMTAANHREGLGGGKDRSAGTCGHGLLSGVDHVGIDGVFSREGTHAEQAVFRLQHDFHAVWNVVGDQGRNTDAEVDVEAVLHFAGDALSHLFAGKCHCCYSFNSGRGQVITYARCAVRCASRTCRK